jgi:carbonic anhydrase/acetyltransferase-like protein (isoleucine patch superfamily)
MKTRLPIYGGKGVIYALDDLIPQIHSSAWVSPSASIIGDVVLEELVSVWFGCTLRGDSGQIRVGRGTNIQDGSVLHESCIIGSNCTIAHQVLVHRAILGDRVLVGNGALLYDGVEIGDGAVVGAGSIVTPGTKIPSGALAMGSPARIIRQVDDRLRRLVEETAQSYQQKLVRYTNGLKPQS